MSKYFVVSDVHSAYTPLISALTKAGFDCNNHDHKLVVCGDLFDRMDETVKCYEFVKSLGDRFIYIRGNHEDLLKDCVEEFYTGGIPRLHHFNNGTVKTICQFCGEKEWIVYDPTWRDKICEIMRPILDWIDENTVNYLEIGDYILTHAWVPTYLSTGDFRDAMEADWKKARWSNPIELWRYPFFRVEGKTVVCGHWHTSAAHSKVHHNGSEWGEDACFDPFYDDGIIMMDGCVAYSGKINCIVIED